MRAQSILISVMFAAGLSPTVSGCNDEGEGTTGSGASGAGTGASGGAGGIGGGSGGGGGIGGGSGGGGGGGGIGGGSGSGGGSVSSSGSGSGSGGGGGAGGGHGVGAPCSGGVDGCDPGLYCNAPGCGEGVCAPKPPPGLQSQTPALVCGCDGVTYWNAEIAEVFGSSVKSAGACPSADAMACDPQAPCPAGRQCNRRVETANACSPMATGVCWGMPISCSTAGAKAKGCAGGTCFDQCSLIQSQNPWYDDGACP
ncbi:hypothetical protein [Polyangium mundeleinium]|uniref:PE-PGRS family protein n=1 Tax=Polyangium mundeleinium TaxID=2995306 RepID=A0ABT5EER8_9BACT|nr:hypothetical protein [Polyangium mundeleinium]MDC0740303.1 hypothetical protein [Polyangium mundeleinium]